LPTKDRSLLKVIFLKEGRTKGTGEHAAEEKNEIKRNTKGETLKRTDEGEATKIGKLAESHPKMLHVHALDPCELFFLEKGDRSQRMEKHEPFSFRDTTPGQRPRQPSAPKTGTFDAPD